MAAGKKQWSDRSERTRKLIIAGAVGEGILKVLALIDIKRLAGKPDPGPKWFWAVLMTVVGSAGILPVSYFLAGRKKRQ